MSKEDEWDDIDRVHRGGGWNSTLDYFRVAFRARNYSRDRFSNVSFRLVRHVSALERLLEVWNEPVRIES